MTEHTKPKPDDTDPVRLRDDDRVEKELNRILTRLAALREDDPAPLNMDFGDVHVTSGRPRKMRRLHSWRASRSSIKYAVAGTYSYSPRFIKKRGPQKSGRLAWNSLFPAHIRHINSRYSGYRRRWLQESYARRSSVMQKLLEATPEVKVVDLSLTHFTFDRWIDPEYELRMDEMSVFTTCLNATTWADTTGVLFLFGAPQMPYSEALRTIDWTQPISIHTLREMKMGGLADLLAVRTNQNINQLVFFQLVARHWTVFHHVLNYPGGGPPDVRWFNSLPASEAYLQDIQDQFVVQQFFVRPRGLAPPPYAPSRRYTAVYLNLQRDQYTCGFWAVYVAFAIILGFNPDNMVARDLDSAGIKELTGSVYAVFVGDGVGASMGLIQNLFGRFGPTVLLGTTSPETIISRRPSNMARAVVGNETEASRILAGILEAPSGSVSVQTSQAPTLPAVTLDENYRDLLPGPGEPRVWVLGNAQMRPLHMSALINGGRLADGILDGFFFCYIIDHLIEKGVGMDDLTFHIADRAVSEPLVKGARAKAGMPPPQPSNKKKPKRVRWFEKFNVFEKNRLILPIYWPPLEHWLLAAVFFKTTSIRIYDSIYQPSGSRAHAIFGRLMEMLLYEHLQLYGTPLPASWPAWSQKENVPHVPQQNNGVDCGLFTITFGMATVEDDLPDASTFKYTPADAAADRIRFANRINIGIRADQTNHKALKLVPRSPSRPPSPALSVSSIHPVPDLEEEVPGKINEPEVVSEELLARQTIPKIDRFILVKSPVATMDLFFPVRVISLDVDRVEVEWFCESLFLDARIAVPSGRFHLTLEEWHERANQTLTAGQVAPIKWPAALGFWHRSLPPLISSSNRMPELLAHLESQLDTMATALRGSTVPDVTLMAIMHDARSDYKAFTDKALWLVWKPAPGIAAEVTQLSQKLAAQVVNRDIRPATGSAAELEERSDGDITVCRIASVMLWVWVLTSLTNSTPVEAYNSIKADAFRQPSMPVEYVWLAYKEVLELVMHGRLHPTLQIIVPGIIVPDLELDFSP
ncbi:hypothetical protein C8R43DRAFT_1104873 [Mycena crocata]|nr:hypothetical protein C8R43DRAFT_1104873 [Mycena crocata]